MSLPLRLHANARQDLTRGVHPNLAAIKHLDTSYIEVFARASADDLGESRDADDHQFTLCPLLCLLAAQPLVVYILHGQPECSFIVATIVCPFQCSTIGGGVG